VPDTSSARTVRYQVVGTATVQSIDHAEADGAPWRPEPEEMTALAIYGGGIGERSRRSRDTKPTSGLLVRFGLVRISGSKMSGERRSCRSISSSSPARCPPPAFLRAAAWIAVRHHPGRILAQAASFDRNIDDGQLRASRVRRALAGPTDRRFRSRSPVDLNTASRKGSAIHGHWCSLASAVNKPSRSKSPAAVLLSVSFCALLDKPASR